MMIDNRAGLAARELKEVEALVSSQGSLEDAVRSALHARPRRIVKDVVAHDELTRDVVIPYGAGLFLVYEASGHGVVSRVAVWDREPSAEELLGARLARGWRPTPTLTRSGPRVIGFAARARARAQP